MAQKWRFFTDCIVLEIGNCTTCEKTVAVFSTFPMFVPSLTWQIFDFYYKTAQKRTFSPPAGEGGGGGGAGACFFT
jgi:hypothetical protein